MGHPGNIVYTLKKKMYDQGLLQKAEESMAGAFKNAALWGAHSPLNCHQIITNYLRRWRRYCREAPDCTSGFARDVDLINTPVVLNII